MQDKRIFVMGDVKNGIIPTEEEMDNFVDMLRSKDTTFVTAYPVTVYEVKGDKMYKVVSSLEEVAEIKDDKIVLK